MAKAQKVETARTEVLTFRLRPTDIVRLKQLSAVHGGIGRAVQVAMEILNRDAALNRKIRSKIQQQKETDDPQELISFSALPRTKALINRLALLHYDEVKNMVLRACIQLLDDMQWKDEILPSSLD